jgi:hypothetical protein
VVSLDSDARFSGTVEEIFDLVCDLHVANAGSLVTSCIRAADRQPYACRKFGLAVPELIVALSPGLSRDR